jgi:hypothetical protein
MKRINLFLISALLVFSACEDQQEQIYDKAKDPAAPVLTIEGLSNFVITEDLPDFYYTTLTWSRANCGKGIPANYFLLVSDNENFTGYNISFSLGNDTYLRALSAAELYGWAIDDFGVYDPETERKEPATLYFRILAITYLNASHPSNIVSDDDPNKVMMYSNVESITCQWEEAEVWEPVELTLRFKAISGGWDEYAVYAWGDAEVYGGWPGKTLERSDDGWYAFVIPVNRPINLIINNNGDGRQFDFLKNPTESLCYEFEIGADNNDCVWTAVDCPSTEPALYMIGEEFGGWDWSSGGVVTMTPVNGFEGHFWAVRYITEGKGFKWCAVRDWNGDFYSIGEDIGYTVSGGNAYVAESGMYMIYVDMANGKISVEPAKVYGMGDCFGGWNTASYPFVVNGKTMTYTTTGAGELRMYAASDIAPVGSDWWRMEFVILDGNIAYRGAGNDQTRVRVNAGSTITLDFNAGTGTIEDDCDDCTPEIEPDLYMIGEEFGGWDWSSDGIVTMTPVHGFEGHFWAIRYITAGKGFKWCPVRDWNGDFNSIGENIGYTVSDGNAVVAESGMYMIYVDRVNGKISVEPARVYGIGECFGSWDSAMYPFEVTDKTMTRTAIGAGDMRLYAASDISPVGGDWWRMEFIILDGKIAYRGAGDDQPRVHVNVGSLITLDFNAGTGTIIEYETTE